MDKKKDVGVDSHFHLPHRSGNPTPQSKSGWNPQSGSPTSPFKQVSKH